MWQSEFMIVIVIPNQTSSNIFLYSSGMMFEAFQYDGQPSYLWIQVTSQKNHAAWNILALWLRIVIQWQIECVCFTFENIYLSLCTFSFVFTSHFVFCVERESITSMLLPPSTSSCKPPTYDSSLWSHHFGSHCFLVVCQIIFFLDCIRNPQAQVIKPLTHDIFQNSLLVLSQYD